MARRIGLTTLLIGGLLAAGAGITVLALWLSGAVWSDGGGVRETFCDGLGEWHETQSTFLQRVNESNSREAPGLRTTENVFVESARLALPQANGGAEENLRTNLREIVRVEEQWLSELGLYEGLTGTGSSASTEQRIASFRRAEDLRVTLNDVLREANAQLEDECGLAPLPLYD